MYYGNSPRTGSAVPRKRQRNFWPLIALLVCAALWLGAIAVLFGPHVAAWCGVVVAAAVGAVGLLALLPLAEGLDTLGIGH